MRDAEVTRGERMADRFRVTLSDAEPVICRKLLIATGVHDRLPEVEGIEALFGTSVFQCPYCDGWEMRDRPTAVYGRGKAALEMARALTAWTNDITLCSDGSARLDEAEREALRRNGIDVIEDRIARLLGADGELRAIEFRGGRVLPRTVLFFERPADPQSRLAETLGCRLSRRGRVARGRYEAASIPGVYVAGNVIDDVQLSIVAAAEGARAAFGINRSLTREDFDERSRSSAMAGTGSP
jgi:thioredoxin reductase